jgi:hypothetical protein
VSGRHSPDPAAPARSAAAADPATPAAGRRPFEYAVVWVVPRIERGERFNAGIVVHSRPYRFLAARTYLDETLLRAFAPDCEPDVVRSHLDAIVRIAAGDPAAGPIARMSKAERFHWLVAPSSTIVQASEVHTGLTADPAAELERLFRTLVEARR